MKSLRELAPNQLPRWSQPAWPARRYELRLERALLARLEWSRPWGGAARGETMEGRWRFERGWLGRRRLHIHADGGEAGPATFDFTRATTGTLSVGAEASFHWLPVDPHGHEWAWTDPVGEQILYFDSEVTWLNLRPQARLVVKPRFRHLPELPLLTLCGWYLMVRQFQRAAVSRTISDALDGF